MNDFFHWLMRGARIFAWVFIGAFAGAVVGFVVPLEYAAIFDHAGEPGRGLTAFAALVTTPTGFVFGCIAGGVFGAYLNEKTTETKEQIPDGPKPPSPNERVSTHSCGAVSAKNFK